jgi:hypothetical protein
VNKSSINILGTSNSVLKGGWVDGLRETARNTIQNLSAGASSSGFVLWQLADRGFPEGDETRFYLLDTLVNDETFVAAKRLNAQWWYYYQTQILQRLPAERTIFIGFSSLKYFGRPSTEALRLEEMCATHGTGFLSLRRILRASLSQVTRKGFERNVEQDVFEDPGHFHRHLARLFGVWFGTNLHLFPLRDQTNTNDMQAADAMRTLVPLDHQGQIEVRQTSLRKQKTIFFDLQKSFRLSGPCLLHGICVDASDTRCYLNIEAREGRMRSVELGYNNNSARMQVKFIHFNTPIHVSEAGVKITVSATPAYALEAGIHSRPNDGPFHGLRLLSFLVGPVLHTLPELPPVPQPDKPNQLSDFERNCVRQAGLIPILKEPPDLPKYPRSFIEL